MTTVFSQVHCTSEESAVSGLTDTTLFDSCSTDSWEFRSELPECWPCLIHSLFLNYHQGIFPEKFEVLNNKHGICFHYDTSVMEKMYQG